MTSQPILEIPSSELLSNLFESLPIGVVAMTADTRVVVFNEHEEQLAGRKRERVLGRRFFDEVAPCMNVRELAGKFRDQVEAATLDETIEFSFPFPTVSSPRDVIVRMRSFIAGGVPHGMLLIEDVSMRRSLERLRETLSNLLVHDMKSPLTNVIVNLELVGTELGLKPSMAAEAVIDGLANAHRLNRMVMDLLDISRLETGTFPLDRAEADLRKILESAITGSSAPARAAGVMVTNALPSGLIAEVDVQVLRRVFDNLLDNAIRHSSPSGSVLVEGYAKDGKVIIDLVDDGPGIPTALRERIFEKFGQSERSGRRPSNHGLGLTFVRMAARAHGGDIEIIDDYRPRGTRFRLTIAAKAAMSP